MKQRKKKSPKISEAVFRGKKAPYNFEVFPIEFPADIEFEDVPAVYIISKRKLDKNGKAHHALVCIGQTESIVNELKRHKKGKCVKKLKANVVSLLVNTEEKERLRIEDDLKAAHSIPCLH